MMSPRRYFLLILLCPSLIIGCYAALNYTIDPFGFYHPATPGYFIRKPAMPKHQRMAKAHIIRKTKPETVILGSSRIDYALNPDHPFFEGQKAYNAGLKGVRIDEVAAMMIHACHSGARQFVWGLDFFSFNAAIPRRPDFSTDRLYNQTGANTPDTDKRMLVSLSALKPMLQTVLYQNRTTVPTIRTNGMHTPEELDHDTQSKGTNAMMAHIRDTFLNELYFPAPSRDFVMDDAAMWNGLESALVFAHDNDVPIRAFIAPQHASHYSLIQQAGLWPVFTTWRTRVIALFDRYGFSATDFTDITDINSTTLAPYYWESSHYTPALGNMILDHLSGKQTRLTATPRKDVLHDKIIAYECAHPGQIFAIRQAIIKNGLENRLIPRTNCR